MKLSVKTGYQNWRYLKQGRIHGYPSRVRVGRGHIRDHSIIWAGAVRPKNKKKTKKVKCDGPMDRGTDGWTKHGIIDLLLAWIHFTLLHLPLLPSISLSLLFLSLPLHYNHRCFFSSSVNLFIVIGISIIALIVFLSRLFPSLPSFLYPPDHP